jgi:hypothetical protein
MHVHAVTVIGLNIEGSAEGQCFVQTFCPKDITESLWNSILMGNLLGCFGISGVVKGVGLKIGRGGTKIGLKGVWLKMERGVG